MSDPFDFEGPVEVVAHRGFSARAPENTLAAMELAVQAGADAVEFDLHCASDGTAYLFHDSTLGRTTDGSGAIKEWSPERLVELDAGAWFGEDFTGEPIPTLEQALDRLSGRVGRVYAEIKGYRALSDVEGIAATVEGASMLSETVFISMDWEALARVRSRAPTALLGYIVERTDRVSAAVELAAGDTAALLDFDARILMADPQIAERVLDASIELATWTVNDVGQATRLLAMGVPRITTNEVELMMDWKATL